MAAEDRAPDDLDALTPRERARQRARDRKRSTRMVVDNAGVKRILPARAAKAERRQGSAGDDSGPDR